MAVNFSYDDIVVIDPAVNQLAFWRIYAMLKLKNYERCKNNKTARITRTPQTSY